MVKVCLTDRGILSTLRTDILGALTMNQPLLAPRFTGTQLVFNVDGVPRAMDARGLISRLLIMVAKGDGGISNLESEQMIEALSSSCDIRSAEVLEQLSAAIMCAADADNVVFLRQIAEGLSNAEKSEIFSMAMDVAIVDGHMAPGELQALDLAGQILGLSQDTIHSELREVNS